MESELILVKKSLFQEEIKFHWLITNYNEDIGAKLFKGHKIENNVY